MALPDIPQKIARFDLLQLLDELQRSDGRGHNFFAELRKYTFVRSQEAVDAGIIEMFDGLQRGFISDHNVDQRTESENTPELPRADVDTSIANSNCLRSEITSAKPQFEDFIFVRNHRETMNVPVSG